MSRQTLLRQAGQCLDSILDGAGGAWQPLEAASLLEKRASLLVPDIRPLIIKRNLERIVLTDAGGE
jgi:hypothetical protein